ncbi:hypothetical protein BGZ80_008506, partial [Entomortierella chlamydospora]
MENSENIERIFGGTVRDDDLRDNEKADILNAGCGIIKESRLLAEIRNETLRLQTMAYFMLISSTLVMNDQAISVLNAADKTPQYTPSPKSPCSSSSRSSSSRSSSSRNSS